MSEPADWALAYARQADVDFRAWQLFEQHPEAVAAECHKLLFLQMACEKLCKAFLIRGGTRPETLQASHGYIAKPLPLVIRRQIIDSGQDPNRMQGLLTLVRHLAGEIEVLNPAVRRDGLRPDNCEYPWEAGELVRSPLNWVFIPLQLVAVRGGPTFLKLLKGSIERILSELEKALDGFRGGGPLKRSHDRVGPTSVGPNPCHSRSFGPTEVGPTDQGRRKHRHHPAIHQEPWRISMSGPIVRKYGFPNFEQIFGKKEPQHGVEDTPPPAEPPKGATGSAEKPAEGETKTPRTP